MLLGAWERQVSDGYVNDHGRLSFQCKRKQLSQVHRVVRPHADSAEGLRELDQVRVVKVGLIGPIKHIVQIAGNVAVGVVPEDDSYHVDTVPDCR